MASGGQTVIELGLSCSKPAPKHIRYTCSHQYPKWPWYKIRSITNTTRHLVTHSFYGNLSFRRGKTVDAFLYFLLYNHDRFELFFLERVRMSQQFQIRDATRCHSFLLWHLVTFSYAPIWCFFSHDKTFPPFAFPKCHIVIPSPFGIRQPDVERVWTWEGLLKTTNANHIPSWSSSS